MTDYLFPPAPVASVPVNGETAEFPIRRFFCVGRNYVAHAAEMGYEVDREKPFYFTKSTAHFLPTGQTASYPPGTDNYHFEMELAVAIGAPVYKVSVEDAPRAIYGWCCALDMTRRNLQISERNKKRPWSLGKDVENSAVVAPITKATDWTLGNQRIWLSQNGEMRQDSTLDLLVWKVPEIISHLSGFYHLQPGDIILTGTPENVGPVQPGDAIAGGIDGLDPISLNIGPAD